MTALLRLRAAGLKLTAHGDTILVEPRSGLTDELRALIRANKQALLNELRAAAREPRIAQATRQLTEAPARRAAYIAGEETDGVVPVTVVIQTPDGLVTGDLAIPKERWDPWLFLKFLEEQDGWWPRTGLQ